MICEVRQSVSNEVSINIFVNIKVNLYIVCAHTYANVCGHTKCLKLMSVSLIKTKNIGFRKLSNRFRNRLR